MKHVAILSLLMVVGLDAQTPAPFVSGLMNPSKLIVTAGGNLLVTETGTTPNSGRISIIDPSGNRKTLIGGLPSGLSAPNLDPDGTNGVLIRGNTLFILNGEGDGFRNGAAPNTIVPNPSAPSSPLLHSLMKLTLPASVDTVAGGLTLAAADQSRMADGYPVTLTDSAGASATLEMVTQFQAGVADPVTAWRNSHPYALTELAGHPDVVYIADAGMNLIWEVTVATGKFRVLTRFAPFTNPPGTMGPPVSDAVPDSVRPYGDQLLVSFLRGYPFVTGGSQIGVVDVASGATTPFIGNLNSAIDVLAAPAGVFFTLEYSSNMLASPPAPGQVTRYDTAQGKVIATGLQGPTNLAYDASSKTLYVLVGGAGTILKLQQ